MRPDETPSRTMGPDQPESDEVSVECPVCRAAQSPRPACRRCGADLALFSRAIASRRSARRLLADAVAAGDDAAATRLRGYLRWLMG